MINRLMEDGVETKSAQQQLLRLNIDFLWMLSHVSRLPPNLSHASRQRLHLPVTHANNLARCSEQTLQRMAGCEFSLFSLSLHRIDTWQSIIATSRLIPVERRYEIAPAIATHQLHNISFTECTLFFAWHLAQHAPLSARLLLGMADDCVDMIAALEPWHCRYIAYTHHKLLSPRWPRHPFFWADLLRYGHSGHEQQYKLVCALGAQLLAQELEPSALLRLSKVAIAQ